MSYYDLPTVVKREIDKVKSCRLEFDDFPICVYHGVFVYMFWDYDLPVEKYRVYGHNYLQQLQKKEG